MHTDETDLPLAEEEKKPSSGGVEGLGIFITALFSAIVTLFFTLRGAESACNTRVDSRDSLHRVEMRELYQKMEQQRDTFEARTGRLNEKVEYLLKGQNR